MPRRWNNPSVLHNAVIPFPKATFRLTWRAISLANPLRHVPRGLPSYLMQDQIEPWLRSARMTQYWGAFGVHFPLPSSIFLTASATLLCTRSDGLNAGGWRLPPLEILVLGIAEPFSFPLLGATPS